MACQHPGGSSQTGKGFDTDARRWAAVQARSAAADGHFVYAVRSTKIYCRPVCSARLARRANVTFYASGQDAERDGYRACKRCRPDSEGRIPDGTLVRRVRSFIDEGPAEGFISGGKGMMSLDEMARRTGMSKWHFHRTFKRVAGVTPAEYVRSRQSQAQDYSAVRRDGSTPGSARGTIPESPSGLEGPMFGGDFSSADYMSDIWSDSYLADFASLLFSIDEQGKDWHPDLLSAPMADSDEYGPG